MDGWMDGFMDAWMDGWINGWMDGWMDIVCPAYEAISNGFNVLLLAPSICQYYFYHPLCEF